MTGASDILGYYQRELDYVRNAGREFARQHPAAARRLEIGGMESPDPHVERLIESFAYLTGRVRRELDNEFPEMATALLEALLPNATAPVPAMTVVHMAVDGKQGKASAGRQIPRHTPLFASALRVQDEGGAEGEVECQFRTCYPLELWPLDIASCQQHDARGHRGLDTKVGIASVLRLRLTCQPGTAFGLGEDRIAPDRLRLHLHGPWSQCSPLYEMLLRDVDSVYLVEPDKHLGDGPEQPLSWQEAGFGEDDAVLPVAGHAHPAYRLMQEYFAFPRKFLFFDVSGMAARLQRCSPEKHVERSMDLIFLLKCPPGGVQPDASQFLLGCTPAINLFPRTTETFRFDQRSMEYRLQPDARRAASTEIHSIASVEASYANGQDDIALAPYFDFGHPHKPAAQAQWTARRVPAQDSRMGGTDIYLGLTGLEHSSSPLQAPLVSASTLCTNRRLAESIRPDAPGTATFMAADGTGVLPVRCLYQPTRQVSPALDGSQLWRLVSLLNLNQLSLEQLSAEPEAGSLQALRYLLAICNQTNTKGDAAQARDLRRAHCKQVVRPVRSGPAPGFRRGFELELEFAGKEHGDGGPLLLAAVLHRFLALYTGVNSFASVSVYSEQKKVKAWPPETGAQ